MTIEGLGKKFQEARRARNLTLDEAARMTKIRPARLAEIEADDFSQFPSLAYAKGFLVIYGKFLDVDVTPYLDAFEDSKHVTVDGYSYLQDNRPPKPVSAPVVRSSSRDRISPMPLIFGILVLVVGFSVMKLIVNLQRLAPRGAQSAAQSSPSPTSPVAAPTIAPPARTAETSAPRVASAPTVAPSPPAATATATPVAAASSSPGEPEVRRAKPVSAKDLATAREDAGSSSSESGDKNRISIRPLKRTYIKVTVDNETQNAALERWISPTDGPVEFRGKHVAIRVLDPDAIQIRKNGETIDESDEDVTIN